MLAFEVPLDLPEWSEAHIEDTREQVTPVLIAAFAKVARASIPEPALAIARLEKLLPNHNHVVAALRHAATLRISPAVEALVGEAGHQVAQLRIRCFEPALPPLQLGMHRRSLAGW